MLTQSVHQVSAVEEGRPRPSLWHWMAWFEMFDQVFKLITYFLDDDDYEQIMKEK